jgi:hypothetical protein
MKISVVAQDFPFRPTFMSIRVMIVPKWDDISESLCILSNGFMQELLLAPDRFIKRKF